MTTFDEPVITPDPQRGAAIAADDRRHVFHSWSAQAQISPLPIAGASGSYFWDFEGKRYLDFTSQLVNVIYRLPTPQTGQGHPGGRRPAVHHRSELGRRIPF